jgi:DNA-binding FadR family transcriptional regulator
VDALAGQLGVSRTPLEDALNLFASEGLVEIVPRRGTLVADLSAHDIAEVFEIRRALELMAADALVARVTSDEVEGLRADLGAVREAGALGRPGTRAAKPCLPPPIRGDRGEPRLAELYEGLRAHIHIGRVHARRGNWRARLRQAQREHAERSSPRFVRATPHGWRVPSARISGGRRRS